MGKKKVVKSKKAVETPKEENPKVESASKSDKPVMGSPDRPYAMTENYPDLSAAKEGVHEIFFVEYLYRGERKRDNKWVLYAVNSTEKNAGVEFRRATKEFIAMAAQEREEAWLRENTNSQKSVEKMVFNVKAKTSDKELEKYVEVMQEARKNLSANPPAKQPKTFKPQPGDKDFPEVRIRRVVVGVGSEDVTPA